MPKMKNKVDGTIQDCPPKNVATWLKGNWELLNEDKKPKKVDKVLKETPKVVKNAK